MRASSVLALVFASIAAAQTTTTTASGSLTSCAADNIVEACLSGLSSRVGDCGGNDYTCLCAAYTDIATCYNNCPGDPRQVPAQQQATQNCQAAKQYPSTTTTPVGPTGASATATDSSASTTSSTSSAASGSAFGTAASSSTQAGAGSFATPAAGALAMIMGAAAML